MSNQQDIPTDAPPSYQQATGGSSSRPNNNNATSSRLNVPGSSSDTQNGISADHRRSMEDEHRPLPKGWVRTFDPTSNHQFFVDTTKDPPKSIWHHPYDDEEYLSTLSSEERERAEQESMHRGSRPSKHDIMAAHSDDDEEHHVAASSSSSSTVPAELPPRPDGKGKGKDNRSFGRKFKDKMTGSTHEEREAERKRRAEEERRAYAQHLKIRNAMAEAAQTGRPVKIGQDRNGKDVFVEPPPQQPFYGGQYGPGPWSGGYAYNAPAGAYNAPPGMYNRPPGMYARPGAPYQRPVGGGFGGGYGLPLALGGGLLGGLLLGDALGGF